VCSYSPIWQGRAQAQPVGAARGGGVPQEPFLFAASIRDNIAFGRDGGFRHSRDFILTECYFQFTVQSFSGVLRSAKLSVVFYGDRDLWMLHNQFSLLLLCQFLQF